MTHDDLKDLLSTLPDDLLKQAVEQVDPNWSSNFDGDLWRAAHCYVEFNLDFHRALEAIADEHAEMV